MNILLITFLPMYFWNNKKSVLFLWLHLEIEDDIRLEFFRKYHIRLFCMTY